MGFTILQKIIQQNKNLTFAVQALVTGATHTRVAVDVVGTRAVFTRVTAAFVDVNCMQMNFIDAGMMTLDLDLCNM